MQLKGSERGHRVLQSIAVSIQATMRQRWLWLDMVVVVVWLVCYLNQISIESPSHAGRVSCLMPNIIASIIQNHSQNYNNAKSLAERRFAGLRFCLRLCLNCWRGRLNITGTRSTTPVFQLQPNKIFNWPAVEIVIEDWKIFPGLSHQSKCIFLK